MHGNGWDMIHSSVPINFKMYGYGKSLRYCLSSITAPAI